MVRLLTIFVFSLYCAAIGFAQPCPTTNQPETQAIRTQFLQKLANNQLDDTLQQLTLELENRYQQADCLEMWLQIHMEYFDKERRINRTTASKWLEKNTQPFRNPTSIIEDSLMMMSLIKKGYNENKLSKIPEARRSYENALVIREKYQLGDPDWMATFLYKTLGSIYTQLGDNDRAINYLKLAKEMCTPGYARLGSIYVELGIALRSQKQDTVTFQNTVKLYQEGLKLENLLPYHKTLFLMNIASTYALLGKNKLATKFIIKCEELVKQFDQFKQKDKRNAFYYTKENQWVFKSDLAALKANYFANESNLKAVQEYEKAIEYAQKAYETPHHREIAKIYIFTGNYYLANQKADKAIHYYQNALQSLLPDFQPKKITDNPEEADLFAENSIYDALEGKAKALIALNKHLPVVLETYNLILDVEDKLRAHFQFDNAKLTLFKEGRARNETAINIANQLYQQTKDKQYLEAAFRFAENSKAAVLLDALNRQKSALISGIPDSLMTEDRTLQIEASRNLQEMGEIRRGNELSAADSASLVTLEEKQLQIYLHQKALQKHLTETYPDYSKLTYQRPAVSLQKLQEDLIKPQEAFVEYFFGSIHSFVFVITKEEVKCLNLGPAALNDRLTAFKEILSSRAFDETFHLESHALYQLLIEPLQLPESINKIIVVADGHLNYVPMQALSFTPEGKTTDYLLNKYLINYTYSADIYYSQLQETVNKKTDGMLAIAPIQFPNQSGLNALPLTEAFIQHLGKEYDGMFLEGKQATKQAFTETVGNFESLVLATHAEAGQQPRIHFYDQALSLNELYGQHLKASTAILMACGTADGKLEGGEGVMSLARALRYAGVPSVTSSLWEVSEESSSTIITDMLANLKKGMAKDEALRAAQLTFMNTVSDRPWRWAAFIHIGNAYPLKDKRVNWLGFGGAACVLSLIFAGWLLLRRKQ